MTRRPVAAVAVLLAAAAILLTLELATGGISYGSGTVANPCRPRPRFQEGGLDGTIQQIVLDGLDGAACRLDTTREELVLSLAPGTSVRHRRWDRATLEPAIRAGLLRAVDAADRRGDLPPFAAPILRMVIEHTPIDKLIAGGIKLRDLFGL